MRKVFDRPHERWQRSKNPHTLARLVKQCGEVDQRKFRLAAAACCRRVWSKLDKEQRRAVEVIERYGDSEAKYTEMRIAVQGMKKQGRGNGHLLVEAARRDAWVAFWEVIGILLGVMWGSEPDDLEEEYRRRACSSWLKYDEWHKEYAMLCHIIRDSFTHVFQPVPILPAWRTSTVLGLAHASYEQRDPFAGTLESNRLRVLADSLEEAGCTNNEMLAHLRDEDPHVRGCWVVDLILAKQ